MPEEQKDRIRISTEGDKMNFHPVGEPGEVSFPREAMVRFAKAILEVDRTGDHITVEVPRIPFS